jgi:methylated-DNA-protein-cysteine methyltransferase related protein
MQQSKHFTRRVYDVVRRIPRGRIASYGGVAAVLGSPRAARGVGHALAALPDDDHDVPWWRVVNRNGEISIKGAPHMAALQRALLEREGVRFDRRGRVAWRDFGWAGDGEDDAANDGEDDAATARP